MTAHGLGFRASGTPASSASLHHPRKTPEERSEKGGQSAAEARTACNQRKCASDRFTTTINNTELPQLCTLPFGVNHHREATIPRGASAGTNLAQPPIGSGRRPGPRKDAVKASCGSI
ncbi:hypothetical protein SNOG_05226 [Parastagonospora nodorum SN15]|uniref:Uncharacterized protein n=1 Tax=Phaeosphaeria nodorum (strain SN15 / ATCC MYA-4574 / FGSC 10173) TaxID=321614 RepID=Q0USN8_PHANO|nr:hypothetical protein SNOG_05226 [Parastagonospora nodorum SN15]EAT87617.1 hypothetical protein SNOG_05226 [Parastagonospora nodorum SN15]